MGNRNLTDTLNSFGISMPNELTADVEVLNSFVSQRPGSTEVLARFIIELMEKQLLKVTDEVTSKVTAQVTEKLTQTLTAQMTAEFDEKVQRIYEQITLARRRMFGASSEASSAQSRLFDEADVLAAGSDAAGDHASWDAAKLAAADAGADGSSSGKPAQSSSKPARGKRLPLPAELLRVDVIHEIPESQRLCPCGTPMVEIGADISEQLDIVPMQIRVLRHIRKRYACPSGDHAPLTAPAAAQVLPKSNASHSTIACLIAAKYIDGLPLARLEHVVARAGVRLTRQTMARWVIGTAKALQPLFNLARDTLLSSPLIHMDETPVQVLKEPGRLATTKSYMWVQSGGPPGKPVTLFDYKPSRSAAVPQELLAGWSGDLMTDGYRGYDAVVAGGGIEHLVCWVHARRRFVEARQVQTKGKRGLADEAIEFIAELYRIESMADKQGGDRLLARQTHSKAVLDQLRTWLDHHRPRVVPKTALGEAMAYLDHYWPKLVRFIERADLPLDNNKAENAIRPFVLGRKAWLFSDTQAGANASALIYSLVETAKANRIEPYLWLKRALDGLPTARTADDFEALLPWNFHLTE
jgi:transposase